MMFSRFETKQTLGPIEFHSVKNTKTKYNGSQWEPEMVWSPTVFKISTFVFSRRNTHTALEELKGE